MSKVAFITGGNGITGSALTEYLVKNGEKLGFGKFIITSRSPFKLAVSDPRISFIALDFSQKPEILAEGMKATCGIVTHAYFSSYVHKDDFQELNKANSSLFENFLEALLMTAPQLQNVTLQTGGKYYGVHLFPIPSPAKEEDSRIEATIDNFYFPQEDFLKEKQKGQHWTWNVVRPEAIIGATPKPNGMNSALTYALYILTCKKLGQTPQMPTNKIYWDGYEDVSYAPLLADLTMYVSTTQACANEAFNMNNGDVFCWRYMWPRLTAYFGVPTSSEYEFSNGVAEEGKPHLEMSLVQWATEEKKKAWEALCDDAGCPEAKPTWVWGTWQFQDWVFGRTWSATLSMSKARRFGWTGYVDSYDSFVKTFEKFKELRQVPSA